MNSEANGNQEHRNGQTGNEYEGPHASITPDTEVTDNAMLCCITVSAV